MIRLSDTYIGQIQRFKSVLGMEMSGFLPGFTGRFTGLSLSLFVCLLDLRLVILAATFQNRFNSCVGTNMAQCVN